MTATTPTLAPPAESPVANEKFAFSGHQTFPLRISWLPKAANAIADGENPFANPREGTQQLGIGKNMVEALGCWVEFFGVATLSGKPALTTFGEALFGAGGFDKFLEDDQTLWLLHWHATTRAPRRFYAWQWVANVLSEHEFTHDEALRAFKAECEKYGRTMSEVTLRQHLDVFLGTYVQSPTPLNGMVAEDLLDSPLAALNFIQESAPRAGSAGKQASYVIDSGPKHTISDPLFRFALHDWWTRNARDEFTVAYRDIGNAEDSPGRVFRLPEREINERLLKLALLWPAEFGLKESNNQRQVTRKKLITQPYSLLGAIYHRNH
jgi:hypothetical protein